MGAGSARFETMKRTRRGRDSEKQRLNKSIRWDDGRENVIPRASGRTCVWRRVMTRAYSKARMQTRRLCRASAPGDATVSRSGLSRLDSPAAPDGLRLKEAW
jgi:hypothetical protein